MSKKLSKLLAVAGIFLLIGGVAGCGSSGGTTPGGDTPGGDNPGGNTPGGDPTPVATSVEINFWHTFGQTIQDNLDPQIQKFISLVMVRLPWPLPIMQNWEDMVLLIMHSLIFFYTRWPLTLLHSLIDAYPLIEILISYNRSLIE